MLFRSLLSVSYHFAFSYCSWGSQGKNTEVVSHSILQGLETDLDILCSPVTPYAYFYLFQRDITQHCNCLPMLGDIRDLGSIPMSGRSCGGGKPTPVFSLVKSHRRRSLAGYSLWGREESETAGQLSAHVVFMNIQCP